MARKSALRKLRAGTVINETSKRQENILMRALEDSVAVLLDEFGLSLYHATQWRLADIVDRLRKHFPEVDFTCYFDTSSMRPDGGVLFLQDTLGELYPVLIAEVKNQGTNDIRRIEGKKKQAKGNAIERLGKNVIGFRTALLDEHIFPFVCFGYGCDFADDSSILDRVVTIAMFGPLNQTKVVNEGEGGVFNRGSFYFRENAWTQAEMTDIMKDIAARSIHYYLAKYGSDFFEKA